MSTETASVKVRVVDVYNIQTWADKTYIVPINTTIEDLFKFYVRADIPNDKFLWLNTQTHIETKDEHMQYVFANPIYVQHTTKIDKSLPSNQTLIICINIRAEPKDSFGLGMYVIGNYVPHQLLPQPENKILADSSKSSLDGSVKNPIKNPVNNTYQTIIV